MNAAGAFVKGSPHACRVLLGAGVQGPLTPRPISRMSLIPASPGHSGHGLARPALFTRMCAVTEDGGGHTAGQREAGR